MVRTAAALLLLCSGASAGEAPPVYGFGATTCRVYLSDTAKHGEQAKILYYSWAQGFITAANALLQKEIKLVPDLNFVDADHQQSALDEICRAAPGMDFSRATMMLLDRLRAKAGLPGILENP